VTRSLTITAILLAAACSGFANAPPAPSSSDAAQASDRSADAAVDYPFGATFPCGTDTCTVGVSYCQVNIPNDQQLPDASIGQACVDLDDACRKTPTCACMGAAEPAV
jgi:hypothetical protein